MADVKVRNAKALHDEIGETMDKLATLLLESHVYGFNMSREMEVGGKKHDVRITFDVDGACFGLGRGGYRRHYYDDPDESRF